MYVRTYVRMYICMYVYIYIYSCRSAARSARTAMKQLPNNKGENSHPHSLEIRKALQVNSESDE